MPPTIQTTHIGSLPRPPELLEQITASSTGEGFGNEDIEHLVQDATERVLEKQAAVGIDVANNGEQARAGFHLHVTDRLAGFGAEAPAPFWADVTAFPALAEREFSYPDADPATGAPIRPAVTGPIEYVGTAAAQREIETFQAAIDALDHEFADLFMTSPSPGIVASSLSNTYYESYEAYLAALADALATEWAMIADAGYVLQIDAPDLLHSHHRSFPDGTPSVIASATDYADVVRLYVDTINGALPDVNRDRIRLHTCWGNYNGPHHLDVGLSTVLPELYRLNVGALAIDLTAPRHDHEWRAFAEHPIPTEFDLIPGVLDVSSNVIDHPEAVADRLGRIIDLGIEPDRLLAGPACGFGTLAWSAADDDIVWAKLESLVAGARIAADRADHS